MRRSSKSVIGVGVSDTNGKHAGETPVQVNRAELDSEGIKRILSIGYGSTDSD